MPRMPSRLHRDLLYAIRKLRRERATTAVAILTMALGTAAVAGIWSVASPVLLHDLPYPRSESLALVWRYNEASDSRRLPLSAPDFHDLRERTGAFTSLAAMNSFTSTLHPEDGGPEQVQLGVVSGEFFRVFSVPAALGRVLEPADDHPAAEGAEPPLVLAHDVWAGRFGADPDVIGRTVTVGSERMTVVGVMPADFRLHLPAGAGMSSELAGWTPLRIEYATGARDGAYLKVIGRLREGVGPGSATADVEGVAAWLRERFGTHAAEVTHFRVAALQDEVVEHVRGSLVLLGAAGILVLLVACGNVSGLLLMRFLARQGELGMRLAMGATRAALTRQLVAEAAVLAVAGTGVGFLLSRWAVPLLLRLEPGVLPRVGIAGIDVATVLLMAAAAVTVTLLGGVLPAALATRAAVSGLVRGARDPGKAGHMARRAMVVTQLALGFVLLYAGVSLSAAALHRSGDDLGFEPQGRLTFSITLPFARYRAEESWTDLHGQIRERLSGLTGVTAVGSTSDLPLIGSNSLDTYALDPSVEDRPWGTRQALFRIISPGYIGAAGIPLLAGRDLAERDRRGAPVAVLVDREMARRMEPVQPGPVIGRRIDVTVHEFRDGYRVRRDEAVIVGIVENVPHEHPRAEPAGTIYLAHEQQPFWAMNYVLKGTGESVPALAGVRRVIAELDPALPIHQPRPLTRVVAASLSTDRFLLALIGVFAGVVVALALVGLYVLMAEAARQRRREFGIRLALGARPLLLARRVLSSAAALAAAGAVAGLLFVPGAEHLLARALPFRATTTPVWLLATGMILISASLACSLIPAGRVARISPVEALRE